MMVYLIEMRLINIETAIKTIEERLVSIESKLSGLDSRTSGLQTIGLSMYKYEDDPNIQTMNLK